MTRVSIVALIALLTLASSADACGRCGIFGRGCRYVAPTYVAPAYVAPQPNVQNFVFNNSFPTQPLGGAYGFNLASAAYSVDPALLFNQAARFTQNAQDSAREGASLFTSMASGQLSGQLEVAKVIAAGQSATAALQAAGGLQQSAPQTFSFQATVRDGKLSVERIDETAPPVAFGQANDSLSSVLSTRCTSCHSGANPKGGLDLTQPVNEPLLVAILDRTTASDPTKLMPPPGKGERLSAGELAPLFAEYQLLKGQ